MRDKDPNSMISYNGLWEYGQSSTENGPGFDRWNSHREACRCPGSRGSMLQAQDDNYYLEIFSLYHTCNTLTYLINKAFADKLLMIFRNPWRRQFLRS